MSKRLEMLEKLVASGKADAFGRYALALEYRSAGHTDKALQAFQALRDFDPSYVPMYLMAGSMLATAGDRPAAKAWLQAGIEAAEKKGDTHAQAEMQDLLDSIE